MNDHQRRIWLTMLQRIDAFMAGELGLLQLVNDLQGLLDAGEFDDRDMIDRWYELWTPLETRIAVGGSPPPSAQIVAEVEAMKAFLESEMG
jgi:hypothetical protein